jgi:hypothetical protein
MRIKHKFVEFIPEKIDDNTLYISIAYSTAVHKCFSGCGNEVVTPLTPTDWRLIFDGETISLEPSIGNWNLPCQSHYWIRESKIIWAKKWPRKWIEEGRLADERARRKHFGWNLDSLLNRRKR